MQSPVPGVGEAAEAVSTILGLTPKQYAVLGAWLLTLTFAFYQGVELEFKHTLSKHLHADYYKKLEATKIARNYNSNVKKSIVQWRNLQDLPLELRGKSQIAATLRLSIIADQNQYKDFVKPKKDLLAEKWVMFVEYYHAYSDFVCAEQAAKKDKNGEIVKDTIVDTSCLKKGLATIDGLYQKFEAGSFTADTLKYPQLEAVRGNAYRLRALLHGLKYKITQTNGDKYAAIGAMRAVGAESYLRELEYQHDPILHPIFEFILKENQL